MIKGYETGELEPSFRPECSVIQRGGSDVVVLVGSGVGYRRPVAHLRGMAHSA